MNFLSKIFTNKKVGCPRCLGKGDVNLEDIKLFKKELFWAPGKCAYCNGAGKVPSKRVAIVSADIEYLTTDLPGEERRRLYNGDIGALKRAKEFEAQIIKTIEQIEHLYYIENLEPKQIAEYLFNVHEKCNYTATEKQKLNQYIEKVINSKQKKQ